MKIRTQKIIRCLTSCIAVLAVVLCSFIVPANASVAGAYNASDFVRAQIANGNDLKVIFSFDSIVPEFGYIRNNATLGYIRPTANTTNGQDTIYTASVTTPADTKDFLVRMFMAGYRSWANTPASASGCIYVGDIVPGSPLDVTCGYKWHSISLGGYVVN